MEDDGDLTQVTMSQRMADKPSTSLRPNHNYSRTPGPNGKIFNDPVHGHFRLDPVSRKIYDTPQFQRLGDLKQLGCTYFVFRGASHARLEHSMGVAHLAHLLADKIYDVQRGELDIRRSDVKCAEVAGLVHDLGHGPFSHVFDRFMRRRGHHWEHEQMSVALLDDILADNLHGISEGDLAEEDIGHVKAMIVSGKGGSPAPAGKRWLYEIVANDRNGLDVDKYDYLMRDSKYCNVPTSVCISRIFSFVKVLDDELCYKYSEYGNIYEVFATRARMFRNVYLHKKASAVEHMVVDALLAAEPVVRLAEKTEDSREFAKLDDTILRAIELWSAGRPGFGGLFRDADEDGEACMRQAQALVARLRRRDLYKMVGEFMVPGDILDAGKWEPPTAQDIISHSSDPGVRLRVDNVIVDEARVDLTRDSSNPMDNVSFFDFPESTEKKVIESQDWSCMMPTYNRERHCRVYSRDSSRRVVGALQDAFQNWLTWRFSARVKLATPVRKPPLPTPAAPKDDLFNPRKRSLDAAFISHLPQPQL